MPPIVIVKLSKKLIRIFSHQVAANNWLYLIIQLIMRRGKRFLHAGSPPAGLPSIPAASTNSLDRSEGLN
ncbi:hypothetical protein [Sphingopyxis sp. 22461]|uniref:hypothetical protein n=1 Tax=Sphingopyxis sp. 22461 TaxID=3453923 RepID=UPI003F8712A9